MDWGTRYCPNKCCQYYGIPFRQGKLVKNRARRGQPQALCKSCGSNVALNYATAYYDLASDPLIFETCNARFGGRKFNPSNRPNLADR